MNNTRKTVEDFLRRFEHNNSQSDFSAAVAQFADTFVAAGPQGAQCVKASDFALALPKRKQLFESFGCDSMQLVSVDAQELGGHYAMAYTRWKLKFTEAEMSSPDLFVDSTFVVDTRAERFRIVLYLAHQDVMALLKERGLSKA
ncbi:MAG TPA: hypothetical protein VHW46_03785 [Terracidiphilus sp.]|jgi:hypothetical protein|nr:hypothetical protein [Terracidiphilus sp.]